jgi:hypothetical protein
MALFVFFGSLQTVLDVVLNSNYSKNVFLQQERLATEAGH